MEISISTSRAREPWAHKAFVTLQCDSVADIAEIILKHVWSPIIWRDGKRNTDNYLRSDLAVFDFDNGKMTLDEALKTFANFRAVIAPTKSHRIEKDGQPAVDRFRVVIPWRGTVSDYRAYRQNLERLYKRLPCDQQCKDGARMYQPSTALASVREGNSLICRPYVAPPERKVNPYYAKNGVMPRFLEDMIREVPSAGNRNTHCFRIAAKMSEYGFSEADAVSVVLSCAADLPSREKEITARSGYRAGGKLRTT